MSQMSNVTGELHQDPQLREDTIIMFNQPPADSLAATHPANNIQRRMIGLVAALLLVMSIAVAIAPRLVGAQDAATPALGAGVTKETLGQTMSAVAPDRVLLLARRTFAPGADSGSHPAPGPVVLYVESGAVTFSVQDGEAIVTRAGSATTEPVKAGSEVTLNQGDEVSYDQGVVHDVYNEGSVPAVTL
jgi:quercetin dioxygenase-like cupin family protein